jgi:hypothetical protein
MNMQWHPPKVVDLEIHVRPKDNTWPTFFKIISEHFAKHHKFPVVYPEVKIYSKKQVDGKLRIRRSRKRAEVHRRDPVRAYTVWLPDSAVSEIVLPLQVENDSLVSDGKRFWKQLVGKAIADEVQTALENKRNALRKTRK